MSWRSKTINELPALAMRGPVLRGALRTVTIAWMYGIIWMTCVQGAPFQQFCQMLGFNDFEFGLMNALPFVATFAQLAAAVIIERTGFKKFLFIDCMLLSRLLWIPVAFIPLMLRVPSRVAILAMLGIFAMSKVLEAVSSPALLTWFGEIIPRRIRGRYFAKRMLLARPTQIGAVIAIWIATSWATAPHSGTVNGRDWVPTMAEQPTLMWTICVMFVIAGFFGAMDIWQFRRIRDIAKQSQGEREAGFGIDVPRPDGSGIVDRSAYWGRCAGTAMRQLLVEPMHDRGFRHYALYSMTLTFGMAVPGSFFWLNAMDNLKFNAGVTQFLFMVISPVLGLIGAGTWGRLLDRWGRRPVLMVATLGTLLSATPWFFATHHTPAPAFLIHGVNALCMWVCGLAGYHVGPCLTSGMPVGAFLLAVVSSLFGGIAWTGVALAGNNIMVGFADGRGRSRFIAAAAVLSSIGGAVGALVGGTVAQWLRSPSMGAWCLSEHPIQIGGLLWNQYHVTFAISMVFRFASIFWLIHMPDPGAGSTRDMVRYMIAQMYTGAATLITLPARLVLRRRT